jgi:acetylornithine deacetylase
LHDISDATDYAIRILKDLIAFDTTSRNSNIALLDYVECFSSLHGGACRRVANQEGTKANLLVRFGPASDGGIILSGHTDVVPVDGQDWQTDPFLLTEMGEKLVGRGTSDMKSFIACGMAVVPLLASGKALRRPLYLALSYDEEVGCLGAPGMIEVIRDECPQIGAVIVGEPSSMKVVASHKGIVCYNVDVTGHEAHSSLTHLGLSANNVAVRLMNRLMVIADELACNADNASPFEPKHSTLNVGTIAGGTAINILARKCEFSFDLRCPPKDDPLAILRPFFAEVELVNREIQDQYPDAGVKVVRAIDVPAYGGEINRSAVEFARNLTGDNNGDRVVPYSSEAGQFQGFGFPTVICGPGSIEQAHQPNEFIEKDQIALCMEFMTKLAERLR